MTVTVKFPFAPGRDEGMQYWALHYSCIAVIIYIGIRLLLTYNMTQLIDMILMINHTWLYHQGSIGVGGVLKDLK